MELSHSWAANRYSTCQEIPCIFCNPKVHYRIHKRLLPVPILRHINSLLASPSHFPRSILILCSYLHRGLLCGFFPSGLPSKTPEPPTAWTTQRVHIWQPTVCVYTATDEIIHCTVTVYGILLWSTAVLECDFYFNDEIKKQASCGLWDTAWTHWLLYSTYVLYLSPRSARDHASH